MTNDVELWGTFSVTDHLRNQPFVTDVLLYDRLVVPVPSGGNLGSSWKKHWGREKLEPLLDDLGDLAVQMPWGTDQSEIWKDRYKVNSAIVQDVDAVRQVDPDAPAYYVTRQILMDLANQKLDNKLFRQLKALAKRPGTTIEAVTAYGSPADLKKGLGMQPAKDVPIEKRAISPSAVFDWTVHVPTGDDPNTLLKQAVSLTQRSDFREHRSYFYTRLRDLKGLSTEVVQKELKKRLADYERIMRHQKWHTRAETATQVMFIAPGLVALIEPISAALLGAAVGAAAFVSKHWEPPQPNELTRVAAMAYDIKAEFGDRLRMGFG